MKSPNIKATKYSLPMRHKIGGTGEPVSHKTHLFPHGAIDRGQKNYATLAVPPASVRAPSYWSQVSRLSTNDNCICHMAEENRGILS